RLHSAPAGAKSPGRRRAAPGRRAAQAARRETRSSFVQLEERLVDCDRGVGDAALERAPPSKRAPQRRGDEDDAAPVDVQVELARDPLRDGQPPRGPPCCVDAAGLVGEMHPALARACSHLHRLEPVVRQATISAACPTIRANRGTVSSRFSREQNSMSASRPGGPYVRAFSPSSADAKEPAGRSAATAASVRSPVSRWTILPAQYASSIAYVPMKPAQYTTTSPPDPAAASETASRFRSEPRRTTSQRSAA